MKRTQIVATLAFAFVLGAVPIINLVNSTSVFATEVETGASTPASSSEVIVTTADAAELSAIFSNPEISKIILGEDINSTKRITINRPVDKPLVVDLNGHKFEYTQRKSNKYAVRIERGDVTFTGTGTVAGSNGFYVLGTDDPTVTENTILTIDKNVTVQGLDVYALVVSDNPKYNSVNYGTRVYLNGKFVGPYGISVDGFVHNSDQAPTIVIGDTAIITANDTPVYAAGYANWTIGAATLTGTAAFGIKSGTFTFNNTNVTIDGEMRTPNAQSKDMDIIGSAIQLEHHNSYAGDIAVTINGGNYTSVQGDVFYEYAQKDEQGAVVNTDKADIDITAGNFVAENSERTVFGGELEDTDIQISGGSFRGADVAKFAEQGYLADGVYITSDGVVTRPSHGFSSSLRDTTLTNQGVTIQGLLPRGVELRVEPSDQTVAQFKDLPHVIYDLTLYRYGEKYQLESSAEVSIKVPAGIDGSKSNVYYIDADGSAEHLASTYADGVITFKTSHFSLYAIVQDRDQDDNGVIVPDTNDVAPDTGLNQGHGALTAVSTIIPLMFGACGIICLVCSQRVAARKKALRAAALEMEIDEQLAEIIDDEPEPTIDHFVAEAIERDDPQVTPVDTFILPNK